jgi:hypothetical protein
VTPDPQNVPQSTLLDPFLLVDGAVEVGFEPGTAPPIAAGHSKPAGHGRPTRHS